VLYGLRCHDAMIHFSPGEPRDAHYAGVSVN
jgi:hypothetical protein